MATSQSNNGHILQSNNDIIQQVITPNVTDHDDMDIWTFVKVLYNVMGMLLKGNIFPLQCYQLQYRISTICKV